MQRRRGKLRASSAARAAVVPLGGAVGAFLLVGAFAACSAGAPARVAPELRAPEPPALSERVRYGGWMYAPDATASSAAGGLARREFILRGTRWVAHADGSIERGREVFREEDVKSARLPPHLGGGVLFHAATGAETLIWRADTFTSTLRPLARVEPPVTEIVPGLDRLYLASASTEALRAIDPSSGEPRELAPLPSSASYGGLGFVDAWHGAVLAGVQGALVTFDAGESWHSIGARERLTEVAISRAGDLVFSGDAGRFVLDARGRLTPEHARGGDTSFSGVEIFARYGQAAFPTASPESSASLPLGQRPLRAAVLAGYPDTPETAVVIEGKQVARVRLSDGKLLSVQPFAGPLPCRGVALGTGFGFVCGDAQSATEVYAYRNGRLELDLLLDGPARVRSSGNGALVIDAACARVRRARESRAPGRAPARVGAEPELARHCARLVSGELLDVSVRAAAGAERIAALSDGRVAIVSPPRADGPGRLSLISRDGMRVSELELDGDPGPAARLLRSGTWLDELWETAGGQLGAWVIGARTFVGVRISLDGEVRVSKLEEGLDETSFHGPFALHRAASGSLRETVDHGFDWHVSELEPALISSEVPPAGAVRGCAPVGCVYDDWVRIGFRGDGDLTEPEHPEVPRRSKTKLPGYAFWNLSCAPARERRPPPRAADGSARGERSRASETSASERPLAGAKAAPESSAWLGFQGQRPPARRAGERGYDFGEVSENGAYRAYAWGAGTGDWALDGSWLVRVGDRFSGDPPWSTSPSRSPWPDARAAAQAFGLDPGVGVDWWLKVGARGTFGVLQIRARSESSIHLLEPERAIVTLEAGGISELGSVSGAFVLDDRWYFGLSRAEQFQLYRVERDKPELVATYPLFGRVVTQLIHSVHGDAIGLWQKSSASGWYVHPIDRSTFEPGPALHVSLEKLGRVPPRCEPGHPGWLVVSGVPLTDSALSESNTHVSFTGTAERQKTKRLTARVIIDAAGVCVDALAALSDGAPPPASAAATLDTKPRPQDLPLTVTHPSEERRSSYHCHPE